MNKIYYCISCGNPLRAKLEGLDPTKKEEYHSYTLYCDTCGINWKENEHIDVIKWLIQEVNKLKEKVG